LNRWATGGGRSAEELEAAVVEALDLYFEAQRREVEGSKGRTEPAFEAYERVRRQLSEVEEELGRIRRRTDELNAELVDAAAVGGSSEASELAREISEISALQQEVRDLAEAEKSAQRRKEEAEETLRRVDLDFEGDLGLAADAVAAFALHKIEEIEALKDRLYQRFAEGRTAVLKAAT
jgi:chromosome segregation ATPase